MTVIFILPGGVVALLGMSWANIAMMDFIATVFDTYQVKPAIAGATDAAGVPNYSSLTTMSNNHNKDDLKDSGETLVHNSCYYHPNHSFFYSAQFGTMLNIFLVQGLFRCQNLWGKGSFHTHRGQYRIPHFK